MDGAAISPTLTLTLALISASALVLGPVLVALINRGPKARAVEPQIDVVADLDEELHLAHRREQELRGERERLETALRKERDLYYERAIRAETALARHGIDIPDEDRP